MHKLLILSAIILSSSFVFSSVAYAAKYYVEVSKEVVVLETTKGTIEIELFPDEAPNTVENFKKLINEKFYDGLTFHRYIAGFVIQGGDPKGNGTGGPGYQIKAEFNDHKHLEGTVAMARSMDPDSAGSQFYICLAPAPHLDHQYTVFGNVIKGMENALELRAGDKMTKVYTKFIKVKKERDPYMPAYD